MVRLVFSERWSLEKLPCFVEYTFWVSYVPIRRLFEKVRKLISINSGADVCQCELNQQSPKDPFQIIAEVGLAGWLHARVDKCNRNRANVIASGQFALCYFLNHSRVE
jgi:hypothetical protein